MADQVLIRSANPSDIPNIHSVVERVWPQTYSPIISPQQIEFMLEMMYSNESLIRQMTEEKCTFLLAFLNDTPVGLASFSEIENKGFKLHKLYVDKALHGKGIGKKLIHTCEALIIDAGGNKVILNVNRYNPSAQFYIQHGYKKIDEVDVHIGNNFYMNDYIMEKILVG